MFGQLSMLALPVIGLNVLGVLALAVDTGMCGRLPNADSALAALGFSTQVMFLLMVAMMGLTIGTVALVARAHGAHEPNRASHVLNQATMLTLALSLAVAVVGNLLAYPILTLLGAEGPTRQLGLDYLRPMLTGVVFSYVNLMYAAVLRGVGNTRLPFLVALLSSALNFLLNYGLILGHLGLPALGVYGAALGTVISNAVGTCILVLVLSRKWVPGVTLSFRPHAVDTTLVRDLLRIGGPASLDMVVINIAFMSIVGMLGRVAPIAVAAHGVGLRIQALAFVPGLSISQATSAMVGQALGKHSEREARAVTRASIVLCTCVMTSLGILFIAAAEPIIGLFSVRPGSELARLSIEWIHILGFGMPLVGVHIALVGLLRGAGATKIGLGINLVATSIQIPLSAFLGFGLSWGAFGIWVAFPVSFTLRMLFEAFVYRRGTWVHLGSRI